MLSIRTAAKAFVAMAGALTLAACTAVPEGVTPVSGFNADRYLGTWYEIARLDHSFERGLTNVTANYSYNDDGSIRVLNAGFDTRSCSYDEREGRATFVGDSSVASLAVSFFGPFAGGYHVIELAPDYSYAVVSGPTKDYFWILARSPNMAPALRDRIIADATANGYPTDELIIVDHSGATC